MGPFLADLPLCDTDRLKGNPRKSDITVDKRRGPLILVFGYKMRDITVEDIVFVTKK